MEMGLAVLLPKIFAPKSWNQTHNLTSALLKRLAQLLLHRGRHAIDAAGKHQLRKTWETNHSSCAGHAATDEGGQRLGRPAVHR